MNYRIKNNEFIILLFLPAAFNEKIAESLFGFFLVDELVHKLIFKTTCSYHRWW